MSKHDAFREHQTSDLAAGERPLRKPAMMRILVVEDDTMIGTLLAEMLTELGHTVFAIEISENGAVEAAFRHQPDLIIIDIGLASGSGLSAMRRILATGPVAHILMTGSRVAQGASDAIVLQKPFAERDLVRAMQRAVGSG